MSDHNSRMTHYGLNGQAAGLLVLMLPIFLNNFYTYIVSYQIASVVLFLGVFIFFGLIRGYAYQFMLLPVILALIFYAIFLIAELDTFANSSLIIEWCFVGALKINKMLKKRVLSWFHRSKYTGIKRKHIHSSLIEYYYIGQVTLNLYVFHLFIFVLYAILPDEYANPLVERLIYKDAPLFIGVIVIIFEQIRLTLLKRSLRTEKWLPIMDKKWKVTGRVPYSISLRSQVKHRHPVVRIAVIYNGMFYLLERKPNDPVFPSALDYPFYAYVLFKQSIGDAVKKTVGHAISRSTVKPRLLIRYPFENDRVNSYVSLYVISVRTEEQFTEYIKKPEGKLWTQKQIEENLGKGVFSEYFEKEYPYLRNTVILAECFSAKNKAKKKGTDTATGAPIQ
ncbi:MAG: hypothetical protein LBH90_05650 [Tannerella sp.]|jgi:hypothetical protein|nr:hypothetical protein [Tannerella sp.]